MQTGVALSSEVPRNVADERRVSLTQGTKVGLTMRRAALLKEDRYIGKL